MADEVATCPECGESFAAAVRGGNVKRYCTKACHRKAIDRRHSRQRSRHRARQCPTCGSDFQTEAGTYCSLPCRPQDVAGAARRAAEKLERDARDREREARLCARAAAHAARTAPIRCLVCGSPTARRNQTHTFCGPVCRSSWHASRHRKGPYALVCNRCDARFTAKQPHEAYCSERCRRRAGRSLSRRTRTRRKRVLEIWGWECYLCGGLIPAEVDVNDPLALTLDHVVPVVAGGLTEVTNLRPAHRACNTTKGAVLMEVD